jgi:flagellar motor switch protein FliM
METPNPGSGQSDIASQAGVENPSAPAGIQESASPVNSESEKKTEATNNLAQPYDFRQQSALSAGELRRLRIRHEEFIRGLAARLSVHLRLDINIHMSKLETTQFRTFIGSLANPTYLALLRLAPLEGISLLEIPPQLGLSIVDRELGGPGNGPEEARVLSEIETRVLARAVNIIAGEWCNFWKDMLDLRPAMLGYENDVNFVHTSPPDTPMLLLGIQLQIGTLTSSMQLCIPIQALEPLLLKLKSTIGSGVAENKNESGVDGVRPNGLPKWNPALDNVKVQLSAELTDIKITAREITRLKIGDVIAFQPEMTGRVQLSLGKKPKFVAVLGASNGQRAARIFEITAS